MQASVNRGHGVGPLEQEFNSRVSSSESAPASHHNNEWIEPMESSYGRHESAEQHAAAQQPSNDADRQADAGAHDGESRSQAIRHRGLSELRQPIIDRTI
jgi:hypothetical protein